MSKPIRGRGDFLCYDDRDTLIDQTLPQYMTLLQNLTCLTEFREVIAFAIDVAYRQETLTLPLYLAKYILDFSS